MYYMMFCTVLSCNATQCNPIGAPACIVLEQKTIMYMYLCIYVSMYLCIYVSMYLRIYLCLYLSIYQSIYAPIYVSMYLCIYLCIYVRTYVRTYACMHACMHVCIKNVCTCLRVICIHTYIHYIRTYITLHYIKLHYITLHCIALHCITYIRIIHTYIYIYTHPGNQTLHFETPSFIDDFPGTYQSKDLSHCHVWSTSGNSMYACGTSWCYVDGMLPKAWWWSPWSTCVVNGLGRCECGEERKLQELIVVGNISKKMPQSNEEPHWPNNQC